MLIFIQKSELLLFYINVWMNVPASSFLKGNIYGVYSNNCPFESFCSWLGWLLTCVFFSSMCYSYVRLELLEGVVAYHNGQTEKARGYLTSAQAKYLQVHSADHLSFSSLVYCCFCSSVLYHLFHVGQISLIFNFLKWIWNSASSTRWSYINVNGYGLWSTIRKKSIEDDRLWYSIICGSPVWGTWKENP